MAERFMYACLGVLALAVAFHLGAQYGNASGACPEIAIETGMLGHGEQIPLPVYGDGTEALEEECVWMAARRHLHAGHNSMLGFECKALSDRTIHYRQYTIEGQYYDSHAQYLIIAVRGSGPSTTQPTTWGDIKARFAE
jgi:hypothetical protein